MTGLRRRSLALSLAAATAFAGAVAAPAVADTTSSLSQGSGADSSLPSSGDTGLPESSSELEGSVQGSLDDNCGAVDTGNPVLGEFIRCGIAVVGGATVLFSVLALLRSVFYEITRF